MIEWLVRRALKYRVVFTLAILSATIVFTSYFSRHFHESDNSLPVWFDPASPDYVAYQNYLKIFGNDRFVTLAFQPDNVFSPEFLSFMKELTAALEDLPDIERVTSLTNAQMIESAGDQIKIGPLVETVPSDPGALDAIKQKALSDPDLVGVVISSDGAVGGLLAKINTPDNYAGSLKLKKSLDALLERLNTHHYPVHMAGPPITDETFNRLSASDQQNFMPIIIATVVLIIFLFFRSFTVALVPTFIQMIVISWILALYYALGYSMNVVTGMLVPIMVAVCIADSVHMMLDYYHCLEEGLEKNEALVRAATRLWRPCFYTALTTVEGFIAFKTSSITPINTLGTLTAVGVTLAFLMTIFFIPVLLSFLPVPKKQVIDHIDSQLVQKFLNAATRITKRHASVVLSIFIFLTLASFYLISHLKVETNFMLYFHEHELVRKDLEFFDQRLSGIGAYEIMVSPREPGRAIANDPDVLKAIDHFREFALQDSYSRLFFSHVSTVKKLNQAFHEGDPAFYRVPDTREEISQLLLLASSSGERDMEQYKTQDDTNLHISLRSIWKSSEMMKKYMGRMEEGARHFLFPLGLDVKLTGFGPLWIQLDNDIMQSQLFSFIFAFVVVSFMMMFFLKSWKVGLISMVPNVLPIFFTMGLMSLFGIHLNVTTVMLAGITIGITVDDTIHYLNRFRTCVMAHGDYDRALEESNQSIGTAIMFTTTTLICGFGVLCFGSFIPSINFGSMVALTLFLSIFCEIFLTPLLVLWTKPFKLKKVK